MVRSVPRFISQVGLPSLPQVQFSTAQADTTRAISRELQVISTDMRVKAAKIEQLNLTTTLRTELNRMSFESKADPQSLKAKIDGYKSGFLSDIENSELAAQWEARYDLEAIPYIDKATSKYNDNLDTQLQISSTKSVQASILAMREILPNLKSTVPEVSQAAELSLNSIFADVADTAATVGSDGKFIFSANQQVAMAGEAQKEFLFSLPPEDRLKALESGKHLDLLTPSARQAIKKATIVAINADIKLKNDDPAKWGLARGMEIDEIVAMQDNPVNASVMPKSQAKVIGEKIKDFDSPDDIISLANELKSTYGEFTFNAVRDLTRAKMPDEYQAAINLAVQDPQANHERIELLFEAGKIGSAGLNEAYKTTTFEGVFADSPGDITTIQDALTSESAEMLRAMENEGFSLDDRLRDFRIMDRVAKAYRIKNPSVSEDEAIQFSLAIESEKFGFAELNDTQYRVPRFDTFGNKLDVDEIEERLEAHFAALEFKVDVLGVEIAKNVGRNIKEVTIPFLNTEQDGVRFRSPSGELLLDKSGEVAELKFADIIALPTPQELKPPVKLEGALGPIE